MDIKSLRAMFKDDSALGTAGVIGGSLLGLPGYICNLGPCFCCCIPTCFGAVTSIVCGGIQGAIGVLTEVLGGIGGLIFGGGARSLQAGRY